MGRLTRGIPDWIRFKIPGGKKYAGVRSVIDSLGLKTICTEARCPNIGECLNEGTATFLILGGICTRNCRYCAVAKGTPGPVDEGEAERVGKAVKLLKLEYAVITSVTRDDLADGGASIFVRTVESIRAYSPKTGVELLVPDFLHAGQSSFGEVLRSRPLVLNHNIEVAGPVYSLLRPMGSYTRSLDLLGQAAQQGLTVKSGLMVGLGESMGDLARTIGDLAGAGCSILTVGQYLRSHKGAFPVVRYYHPAEFDEIASMAKSLGFARVESGPLVRSSYRAARAALL